MYLLYYFLFLDKTHNKQNQERFILCQKQSLEVFQWWNIAETSFGNAYTKFDVFGQVKMT